MTEGELPDDVLWESFHARTLPEKSWTHRAHLRMAWMTLKKHAIDEAHVLIRVGIIRLNHAHGLVETAERGYHDTLTYVWLRIVAAMQRETPDFSDSRAFLEKHTAALAKDAPLRHYSRARLMSLEARARCIDPDLAPLP
ncbi:MAG: hypothetical protein ACRELY_15870 [Polyangiaceae bacterium]